jgi:hypothetical protein
MHEHSTKGIEAWSPQINLKVAILFSLLSQTAINYQQPADSLTILSYI